MYHDLPRLHGGWGWGVGGGGSSVGGQTDTGRLTNIDPRDNRQSEKERETETETDRETKTETERQTERETDKQTERTRTRKLYFPRIVV